MKTITTNAELSELISEMNPSKPLYAIRTSSKIDVFESIKEFNAVSPSFPNAVQGELTAFNYVWYRF